MSPRLARRSRRSPCSGTPLTSIARALRATSIRQKIATLRSFVSYLRECHPAEAPGPGQVRIRYRAQRRPRLTLSFEQLRALLDHLRQRAQTSSSAAPDERRHLLALPDHALFALLAGTGMRIGEALAIELDDLDLDRGHLQIHGKGGHERIVFCDLPELRVPLQRYVDARAQATAVRTPRLFVNGRDLGPLSSRAAQLRLRGLASEIDLPNCVTPHVLRHTYATSASRTQPPRMDHSVCCNAAKASWAERPGLNP